MQHITFPLPSYCWEPPPQARWEPTVEEYREAEAGLGGGRAGGALPRAAAELMTAHAPEDGLGLMELADELEATGRWARGGGYIWEYEAGTIC